MQHYIPNPTLKNERVVDVLRLIRSENIGPVTFYQLVKFCGSVTKALEMAPEMSRRGGRKKPIVIAPKAKVEKELEALTRFGAEVLLYGQPEYPRLLQTVTDAPPALIVLGQKHLLTSKRLLGVVGARNASANGSMFTRKIVADLGAQDCTIVSGLARGIDTAAHHASLKTGTIAVIAGGVDTIYPPENERLYHEIRELGVVVSEAPFGSKPMARHFPARNRIIAGMSQGLLVVEASLKSGSLITANYANDYGREVFSVPGSPLDPRCKGTNQLIRDGAHVAESAADIFPHLQMGYDVPLAEPSRDIFPLGVSEAPDAQALDEAQKEVLQALGFNPTTMDALLAATGLPTQLLLGVILELELAGRVQRLPGGTIALNAENTENFSLAEDDYQENRA